MPNRAPPAGADDHRGGDGRRLALAGTLVVRAPARHGQGWRCWWPSASGAASASLWSVSPDSTWAEANRALTYALVLGLAIAFGASHRQALTLTVAGFLAVALAVSAYALGQKLFPGFHIAGFVNLDQTGQLPRLQEPFGYWNALGLFVALAVPLTLSVAVDRERSERLRTAAAAAVVPLLVTIAFTYSRGAVLALVCGLAAGIALSGVRLRWLLWLGLVVTAAAAPVFLGLFSHSLTAVNVNLGDRELAGVELAAVIVACMTLVAMVAPRLIARDWSKPTSRPRGRDGSASIRRRGGGPGGDSGLIVVALSTARPGGHGVARVAELHHDPGGGGERPGAAAVGRQ